ncbi:uncharacterized protein LOC144545798 isoform X2 [Carex rostrata]
MVMARSGLVPLFIDTSLDTHLAIAISPHDTVASVKRMIMAEHPVAFPVMGEIIVRAVKTGLKGVMFKLSDSIPVSTLLNDGNILCYVEAVTTNHERNLRNGRVDEELKVPIGGTIEDLMVNETSEVGAADFRNNAVKERSRKKRTKTKVSSSDIPHEVPPIGEDDSEKAGDKVHKSNQIVEKQRDSEIPQKSGGADNSVPCQLDKERVERDISFPVAMADSKEDSGNVFLMEVIKEKDNVKGGDPGVFSLEKRRRKKNKATENESGQEKGNDLILEKEIIKEVVVVDTSLINIAGGDPGVASKQKRKNSENKQGRELSAIENDSSKKGESNLMLEKEASKEADDAHFTKNAETEAASLDGWTGEEEIALRNAFFLAQPSPHFWKKVSKMVPGKNAQQCFNKIHSNFATPPSIPSKKRWNKGSRMDSPLKKFNLLEPNSPKARKVSKLKKIRDARKNVRHLLKKQQLMDQVQDADYYYQFEASPVNLPSDVKFPRDFSCKDSLNSDPEIKLKPGSSQNQPDPSPAVLKQVKNMELHEKYLDHLHSVDARRKACVRAGGKKGKKKVDLGTQARDLKDAKSALMLEAYDFIGCFKKLQADPFGDFALSDEDDQDVF